MEVVNDVVGTSVPKATSWRTMAASGMSGGCNSPGKASSAAAGGRYCMARSCHDSSP